MFPIKYITVAVISLITASSFAQNKDVTKVSTYLESAQTLFKNKKYKESITESDKGLALNGNCKDSLYIELLANKALCYNWLNNDSLAIPLFKEAIITYRLQGKIDKLLSHICRYYCQIASASSDKLFYHSCILDIFKTRHIHKDDYKIYKKSFLQMYGFLENSQLTVAFENEEREIKGLLNLFYSSYFEYLKGYIYSLKTSGGVAFDRSKENKTKAIPCLENAIKGLKKINTLEAQHILIDSYSTLADVYESLGQNASSAFMHGEILSLLSNNWEKLGYETPWSFASNYVDYKILRFKNYVEQLSNAKMYNTIIDYCREVLEDPRLQKAGDDSYIYVLETLKDAYSNLGDYNLKKEVSDRITAFKEGKGSVILEGDTEQEEDNTYELLLKEKKYDDIISSTTDAINSHLKKVHESEFYGYVFSQNDVNSGACTIEELEIDSERGEWHHANCNQTIWSSYYYRALAYLSKGDYEKAIKDQLRVVEIVRLDWKYVEDERDAILYNYESGIYTYETYLETEIDMTIQMANIYLKAGRYSEAFFYYDKALKINLQILQAVLSNGSQKLKEEEWDKRNYLYYTIIENLSDEVNTYPRFADLILEASAILKGFLLNFSLKTKDAIVKADQLIKNIYEEKNKADILIEQSCYNPKIDLQNEILKSQNSTIEINNSIKIDKIIKESHESFPQIRNRLHTNDVLVDFFTLYKGDDIEKGVKIEKIIEDNDTILIKQVYTYYDFHLYATVLRKEWLHPKVIFIGKISDATISSCTGKDLIDYLYYNNNVPSDINDLYKSTSFTHFMWDKIIVEGGIQKDENIYFIPTGLFNRLAIESLPMDKNNLISDYYNVYRLSSIREMHHAESVYSQSDRCVAFGDISYTSHYIEDLTNAQVNTARTMAANPEAILDRSLLGCLRSTRSVIETISQVVNNTRIVTGTYANEKAFYELSGNSPEILFLGTHGYNFENKELKESENAYLFGDRRKVYLSDSEKGMYTSGLYLAPSNTREIYTDGMLTAKEISMQDLSKTKLAVLSACSTAIGISSHDGVYGVQRGFKMAGVRLIIASLWDVDAKATQVLMTELFKQYTTGIDIHKALRLAQKHVRDYVDDSDDDNTIIRVGNGKVYANPYYWAGFILID